MAKWIYDRPGHYKCSECGYMEGRIAFTEFRQYCPVCGAKMNTSSDADVVCSRNTDKFIKELEWILEDDRFGFGVNWKENSEPKSEEEQAGYIIQRVINFLKAINNPKK